MPSRIALAIRAGYDALVQSFRVGGPLARTEWDWGHDQSEFSVAEYGQYIALSANVYAAARLRAQNLAQLRLRLYKVKNGSEVEVTTGQLATLLHKVNPYWTFGRLLRMTELSLCLWGQSFWVLERGTGGRGVPREIWWARPEAMRPVVDPQRYIRGYIYELNGDRIAFAPQDVIWIRYENPLDEFSPLSPIAAARLSIESGRGALRSNRAIFQNGLNLAGVVSPVDPKDRIPENMVQELEQVLDRRFRGEDRAHKVAILSRAVKFDSISLSPKDAEFLGLLQWSLLDTCRVYQIPPPLLQEYGRATWGNLADAHKQLWQECILPEARMIAEEITEQLLPLFNGEADIARFDESAVMVLQEDRMELVEQMVRMAQIGVPLNALLAKYEPSLLPPSGGYPWGDVWWAPLNLAPAQGAVTDRAQQSADLQSQLQLAIQSLRTLRSMDACVDNERQNGHEGREP